MQLDLENIEENVESNIKISYGFAPWISLLDLP